MCISDEFPYTWEPEPVQKCVGILGSKVRTGRSSVIKLHIWENLKWIL